MATFSSAVMAGMRLKLWKMNPILWHRTQASWLAERSFRRYPSMSTSPAVGVSSPPIMLKRVDFPEPEGPMMDT